MYCNEIGITWICVLSWVRKEYTSKSTQRNLKKNPIVKIGVVNEWRTFDSSPCTHPTIWTWLHHLTVRLSMHRRRRLQCSGASVATILRNDIIAVWCVSRFILACRMEHSIYMHKFNFYSRVTKADSSDSSTHTHWRTYIYKQSLHNPVVKFQEYAAVPVLSLQCAKRSLTTCQQAE